VCVKQQRQAFDLFEPFEQVDPPICIKTVAGQRASLEGAPANSDLVLTAEYEGLRPVAFTSRTGDYDTMLPPGYEALFWVLLEPGAVDPWIERVPEPGDRDGLVTIRDTVRWIGSGPVARPEILFSGDSLWGGGGGPGDAGALRVRIEPAGGADLFEVDIAATTELSFVSLPEGSARVDFINDNERLRCTHIDSGGVAGLPAGVEAIEVPVLAGHDHLAGFACTCANGPGDGELLDLAACTFAPGEAADADAGQP
jgi:hypothetical protein